MTVVPENLIIDSKIDKIDYNSPQKHKFPKEAYQEVSQIKKNTKKKDLYSKENKINDLSSQPYFNKHNDFNLQCKYSKSLFTAECFFYIIIYYHIY